MRKKIFVFSLLLFMFCFGNLSSAATSTEGVIKNVALQTTHHGIKVDLWVPWGYGTPNIGEDGQNYFDFYLGYDAVEAGLFYYTNKGWTFFLNTATWADTIETGSDYDESDPNYEGWKERQVPINPGEKVTLTLKHNGDYTATVILECDAGTFTFTNDVPTELKWDEENRIPATGSRVKMVHGKVDETGKMYYKGASFTNPQLLRGSPNGTWVDWTASSWGYSFETSGDVEDFSVLREFPLKSDLN